MVRGRQHGFTYLGALFLVVLMGAALAGVGQLWSTTALRAKERELIWVGTQYARALRFYYENSPGVKQYPQALEELLEDNRSPVPRRFLRRMYADPFTGEADWALIRTVDGRIAGVRSQSSRIAMKTARFPPEWTDFEGKTRYDEWEFVADRSFMSGVEVAPPAVPAAPAGPANVPPQGTLGVPLGEPLGAPSGIPLGSPR